MKGDPQEDVILAPLTTWKIGGPAEYLWLPESEPELVTALQWARERNLPVQILGRGSNILVSDEGIKGLVISLKEMMDNGAHFISKPDGTGILEVPAGISLPRLSKLAAGHGYTGYEFYIGIPGTVGGAVTVNAGYGPGDERQTANRCIEVRTLSSSGELTWNDYSKFKPVYRHTKLLDSGFIVTAARFALKERAISRKIREETAMHLELRRQRQPLSSPTAGSVFKATRQGIPAAVFIEQCGLKGTTIGGARVSEKHANWIENIGGATARDVMELIQLVKQEVLEKCRVELDEEILFLADDSTHERASFS
ncbi:MAG: UDP-N-acetylmuramate dehydrogenase [Puniceicoccaceae bacterium]